VFLYSTALGFTLPATPIYYLVTAMLNSELLLSIKKATIRKPSLKAKASFLNGIGLKYSGYKILNLFTA
jgi:hypothetical protein